MKEHEQFEKLQHQKFMSYVEFSEKHNVFVFKQPNTNLDKSVVLAELNFGWKMWQASANRAGMVLVPREATEEMINSADPFGFVDDNYKAMIEAWEQSNES